MNKLFAYVNIRTVLMLLFLIGAYIASYTFLFDAKLDLNGDNATYISLARNLTAGHGYSDISPDGYHPVNHFPPAYSVFLALLMKLGISSLVGFKIANGVLLCVSLILLFLVSAKLTGKSRMTLCALILSLSCFDMVRFAQIAMSEMLYMFFIMLTFVFVYKYTQEKKKLSFWKLWSFYAICICCSLAIYTRTIGLSLLLGILVLFACRKEWFAMVSSAALVFLTQLPWTIRNKSLGLNSRYMDTLLISNPWRPDSNQVDSVGDFFSKIFSNVQETVIVGFRSLLFPSTSYFFRNISKQWFETNFMTIILGILILAVVVYGLFQFKQLKWFLLAFLVGNIGLLALWHGGNDIRYVIPITPFIYLFFFIGLGSLMVLLWKKITKKTLSNNVVSYAILLLIIWRVPSINDADRAYKAPYHVNQQSYIDAAVLLNERMPQGIVVACRKPEIFTYFAPNLVAVRYPFTTDTKEFLRSLIENNVLIIVLDSLEYSSSPLYLFPFIQETIGTLTFPVYEDGSNGTTSLLYYGRDIGLSLRIKKALE